MGSQPLRLTRYAAFAYPETGVSQIGHLDSRVETIQPLQFLSGHPVEDLYQVIEAGSSQIVASGPTIPLTSVKLLAPLSDRDVLAVGKNYMEHAKEFNSSGYDSSDKVDQPSHPVIFTKRATSIVGDGDDVFLHPSFTQSLDYEGEIGIIIGKAGYQVPKENAIDYVWGYTIINDVTAREKQRDHKQFFIGKSADTFCPIGPVAIPKEDLPSILRIQTHVNGELRQNATTKDLIFDIGTLISTLSEGQTLQPGDIIASGTPAGVGIGRSPPLFLTHGDEVAVTVSGIGTLRNRITCTEVNAVVSRGRSESAFQLSNASRSVNATVGLTTINGKPLHYQRLGSGKANIVFVHGLGATTEFYSPVISHLQLLELATLHLFDFEGHGLSPTHPLSVLTMESLAADLAGIFKHAGISTSNPATLVAHSMGCVIALTFVLSNPGLVNKLLLLGPPPSPLPESARIGADARGSLAQTQGMNAIVDAVVLNGTSERTKQTNPVAVTAARLSLLGQEPESYAKACGALAKATTALQVEAIEVQTIIVTGSEDKVSPPALAEQYSQRIKGAKAVVLPEVGHWHTYEDVMKSGLDDSKTDAPTYGGEGRRKAEETWWLVGPASQVDLRIPTPETTSRNG
ncbi:hypothetical protein TARUN_2632 [Trichoderma arundinaceum]|uniref:Fumarylacetoacetate hydrolase n=1 Tax=Trichoderma arundinaceum TaxID=490622 RepID=A0A395NUB8_TRIAR|nr:hypothetical protein TARUN_2632 [Trichoderma arundinaceum]